MSTNTSSHLFPETCIPDQELDANASGEALAIKDRDRAPDSSGTFPARTGVAASSNEFDALRSHTHERLASLRPVDPADPEDPGDTDDLGDFGDHFDGIPPDIFTSSTWSKGELKEHLRQRYREILSKLAAGVKEQAERKDGSLEINRQGNQDMFLGAMAELQEEGPNILVQILQRRMDLAREMYMIPSERPMDLAGFVRRGLYQQISEQIASGSLKVKEPPYYRDIEVLAKELFAESVEAVAGSPSSPKKKPPQNPIFAAITALERYRKPQESDITRDEPLDVEGISISMTGRTIELVPDIRKDLRPFRNRNAKGKLIQRAATIVGRDWDEVVNGRGWFEAFLVTQAGPKGQYGIVKNSDGTIRSAAKLPGSNELEAFLTLGDFFGKLKARPNALEDTITLVQQIHPAIDITPLQELRGREGLTLKQIVEAAIVCTINGQPIQVNELLQLTVPEGTAPAAYEAVKDFVTLMDTMGTKLAPVVTESYPFTFILEILQRLYNEERLKKNLPPVLCYTVQFEVIIDNGTDNPVPTHAFTANIPIVREAMQTISPEKILTVLRSMSIHARQPYDEAVSAFDFQAAVGKATQKNL